MSSEDEPPNQNREPARASDGDGYPARHRPVVTIAALYGAAGTVIGPRVAERLGVPFLDRSIPAEVAERRGVAENAVEGVDEQPRSRMEQLIESAGRAVTANIATGPVERLDLEERRLRGYIEEFLAESSRSGGVTLGRGGMVVLRLVPWALHVHLGGPRSARALQRMALEGIDRETAERRLEVTDRTRIDYVRRVYGVDGEDPSLYHLMLDSTALDLDTCVDLIVTAAEARVREPRPAPTE